VKWASGTCLLLLLAVLPVDPVVAATGHDLADRDLPAADLIVVLDGTPSRLAQAERYRQQALQDQPLAGQRLEPERLLIRCPRAAPPPQPMAEVLQGYDTATQITALADWLRRRQAPPPQRLWIATDPDHTARATLLARIALAGRGIQILPDPPPPPSPGERRKLLRDALRLSLWRTTGSTGQLAGASGRCPQTGGLWA
jgi:hypothetical protein